VHHVMRQNLLGELHSLVAQCPRARDNNWIGSSYRSSLFISLETFKFGCSLQP